MALKCWLQLRYVCRSTPTKLQFDRATTFRQHTLGPGCCMHCGLNKQDGMSADSGLCQRDLNDL